MNGTWRRWVPAVVVPAVIAAGALVTAAQAGASADLPDKSAEQVLAMVGESSVEALSGTVEQTSNLGLPALPTDGAHPGSRSSSGAASALELLTGSHTARVFVDGPTRLRVQVLDTLAERNVVRNGQEVWLYSSADNAATHLLLPSGAMADPPHTPGEVMTPAALAHELLATLSPSTRITVGTDSVVAGRPAYDLVLTPLSADTLIGSVSIAVDSETGLPLRVDLRARGQQEPAFQVAFTQLSLQAPPAARFEFTPPPGATVTEQPVPGGSAAGHPSGHPAGPGTPGAGGPFGLTGPTVSGAGWDAIVEVPLGADQSMLTGSPLLDQMTRAVPGGRLLHTALVNVLLTDDGRVLVGSVPLERLQAAAVAP